MFMASGNRTSEQRRISEGDMADTKLERGPLDENEVICDISGSGVESESTEGDDRITEPFDPTLIRVETKPMSMDLLIARIREGELDLMPGFQRKAGIWSDGAQSRLIESMLIRIPLPAFYMDATEEDKWLIVDGLQRLTTIRRFVIDKQLRLSGLEFLDQFEGRSFEELPRNFQRRINETQVTVYLIEKDTPPEVKFNIFKRINTGGLPLSSQEIRHALNQGKATRILEELANSKQFRRATDYGIQDKRMADRECVLRFMAFTIFPYSGYKTKDFDAFLNNAMANLNEMPSGRIDTLKSQFLGSMVAAHELFGRYAFRKLYKKNSWRYPINKALFETWSVNLSILTDDELKNLKNKKEFLTDEFIRIMTNRDFESAISQGTGDIKKVKLRFSSVENIIREVLK